LLGLLAALLAHTVSYGNNHVAGGSYHGVLELLALAGAGGFGAGVALLAWLGAARHADGSILAARLRPVLPDLPALAASATLWFAIIEGLEPEHPWHAPILLVAMALAATSIVLLLAARAVVGAIAAIVFAIARAPFVRRPACFRRRFAHRSSARRAAFVHRRFARPPPGVKLLPV